MKAKARTFVFVSKTAKREEIAETIVEALAKMAKIIATHPAPFIARILLSGHVEVESLPHASHSKHTGSE